jgi:radical SAM protein with 4Fe4S-binding SPASM domain
MIGTARELNNINATLDATYLSERVLAYPKQYYIAVSVVCDLRCPYCPRQFYARDIDQGLMRFEEFLHVADYLAYAEYAGFFGLGEPFLHPEFLQFLVVGKEKGAYVATSTHGASLKPDVARRLVEIGLDELDISVDGHTKRLFELLREGASFEEVIANIEALNCQKEEHATGKPAIFFAVAVSRHNVRHMEAIVKLAKQVRAARVVFTDLIIVDQQNEELSVYGTRKFSRHLERAKHLGEHIGVEVLYFHQKPFPWVKPQCPARAGRRYGCPAAWSNIVVEKNGDIRPCCYIEPRFGNCFETPLGELINSEAFCELRRSIMEGRLRDCCNECGALVELNDDHVERMLNEAERSISELPADLPARRELLKNLEQYRSLYSSFCGENV